MLILEFILHVARKEERHKVRGSSVDSQRALLLQERKVLSRILVLEIDEQDVYQSLI
jgi:hypothetical protein